jgi:hypothetical protein
MQKIKLSSVILMLFICLIACKKSAQPDNPSIYGPLTSKVWTIKGSPIYDANGILFKDNGETFSKSAEAVAGKWVLRGDTIKFTFATSTFEKGFHYIGILSNDKTSIRGIVYLGGELNDQTSPAAYFQAYADGSGSASGNMNIENAIAKLNAGALPDPGGKCAYYVRLAFEAGKIDTKIHPALAKDYGPFLLKNGFLKLTTNFKDGTYIQKPGDVAVFEGFIGRLRKHKSGHIQMFNGSKWVSDWIQPDFIPGPDYRSLPDPYVIYRPY